MSTKNVTLKEKVNGALGDTLFPATTTPNVYDSAKSQALSATLVDTPDYEALGYAKFSTASAYNAGDKVYKDNEIYRFIADKPAGEWDSTKVEQWSVEQDIEAYDEAIRTLIPAQASADNKLADKAYVNDKVSTDTATFRGTFNLVIDLELTTDATEGQIATALNAAISGEDKNDYAFVQIPTSDATPTEIARIDRYKYNGTVWVFEYSLNNSGFTAEQWAAINSGITSSLVTAFGAKYDKPAGGIPKTDLAEDVQTSLGKADTALQEHIPQDDVPTENSTNNVKSGGVFSAIVSAVASAINSIKAWATNLFAKQDGWYDTLVSGAAKNLVGHGTTPAEYTFRPSGGNADIGTGTASIDVMKGKTLKFKQYQYNGNFEITSSWARNNCTISVENNILIATAASGKTNMDVYYSPADYNITEGHKVLVGVSMKCTSTFSPLMRGVLSKDGTTIEADKWHRVVYIGTKVASQQYIDFYFKDISEGAIGYLKDAVVFDLTEIFGEGSEPSTVAEFEAIYPLDYYPYTATPVLINNAASGIVTTEFSQWDEQWEVVGGSLKSKNYIKVFPNTTYYFHVGSFTDDKNVYNGYRNVYAYDANFNLLSSAYTGTGNLFTTGSNVAYIKFALSAAYGTTYKNDICINLSWSGYRNGEYEPYEKHTLYFDTIKQEQGGLNTVKGRLLDAQGEPTGDSVTIFPDGMKSAGSVYDFGKADSDGYIRKVTKRIGSVDLGNLSWTKITNSGVNGYCFHSSAVDSLKHYSWSNLHQTILCSYLSFAELSSIEEGSCPNRSIAANTNAHMNDHTLYAYDSAYTDAATFKTAMSGVMFYYELATPEEYLLDTPIPANYIVNDFGTEQRIPVDTASNVMAPILYDCKYALNAVDTVRRLPITYIKKESMDNFTTELASKLGSFLNATITITPSYDATNEEYDYSISITANENNG